MKPNQQHLILTNPQNLHAPTISPKPECPKAIYQKPNLIPLGSLQQIVRGASAKGCDCAGELDLSQFPF